MSDSVSDSIAEKPKKPHDRIDPLFKEILVALAEAHELPIDTEVETGRLPRKIDGMMRLDSAELVAQAELKTPLIRLKQHNQIELKGRNDPLSQPEYRLVQGRTNLYMGEKKLSAPQISVTIVCAAKPRTLLTDSQDDVLFKPLGNGYYISDEKPPTVVIALNELAIVSKNYRFLLFVSSKLKFRQFLKQVIEEGALGYLQWAYRLQPQITKEELMMITNDPYLSVEDFEFIANDIGPDLLKFITIDKVIDRYGEKGIDELPFIQTVEQRGQQRGYQLGELHRQRHLLRQQMQHKFSDIPTRIISQIERTEDMEQLERWSIQILAANSWQEMGF